MNKVCCSFSGGKTSAYMAALIKQHWADREVVYVFANTGQEREESLRFVQRVDEHFRLGVVWVEAVIHPEFGEGTTHKIVDFASACRDGSLFASMCATYGIPNAAYPHCTRELKLNPIYSYLRSIGWQKNDFVSAVGIRTDEQDRAGKQGCIYPLVDTWPVDKQDVNTFWEGQPFNLGLREYQGNCKWCWKKSESKLVRIAKDDRAAFDVPMMLEREYGHVKAPLVPRKIFRKHQSTIDLLNLADIWPDQFTLFDEPDKPGGCGESCDAFSEAA